jgi:hypothetical protein
MTAAHNAAKGSAEWGAGDLLAAAATEERGHFCCCKGIPTETLPFFLSGN